MATTQGSDTAPEWDLTTDVLIVGYGGAGVSAAIEAREAGADVLAVDAYTGGGATAISGGIIYAGGGTAVQRLAGVADDTDEMFRYLQREVGDAVGEETLRRFCEGSADMIDWMSVRGVPFSSIMCPFKTSYPGPDHSLYFSGSEAAGGFRDVARPAPRGHKPVSAGLAGSEIYSGLAAAAAADGVELWDMTRVVDLVTDDSGRVIGVRAQTLRTAPGWVRRLYTRLSRLSDRPGVYQPDFRAVVQGRMRALERRYARPVAIGADAVVLTTGGFIANRAMVRQHAPDYSHGLPLGTAGCDGSGIEMAQRLGAATDKMGHVSVWRFITPPVTMISALSVAQDGSRIGDESRYGAALGGDLVADHGGRGWLLLDAAQMRSAGAEVRGQSVWFQYLQAQTLMRMRASTDETIERVAAKAGVDPAGLRATVDAHNEAISAGRPDPAGKPDEFRRAVQTGPFTLLDISTTPATTYPTPMLTLGGLVVDEETGAVRREDGTTIPSLFAAGRAAVGFCSNSYVSGLSISDAVFSGRRAGRYAAQSGEDAPVATR